MALVDANIVLGRDEQGKLLPVDQHVPEFGGDVRIIPMSRSEMLKIEQKQKNADSDELQTLGDGVIKKHLVEPDLSEEQIEDMPQRNKFCVTAAIMAASTGMGYERMKEMLMDNFDDAISQHEEILKKK